MNTLQEVRDALLDMEDPASALLQAENLLDAYDRQRGDFVLPHAQLFFRPILDQYVDDLEGWLKFINNVRVRLPLRSDARNGVQVIFRRVGLRLTQQQRRERERRAVMMAIRKGMIKSTHSEKVRYGKRCVQAWNLRRTALLKNLRSATGTGRLSTEEREQALAEFWQGIDDEIDRGELPKP